MSFAHTRGRSRISGSPKHPIGYLARAALVASMLTAVTAPALAQTGQPPPSSPVSSGATLQVETKRPHHVVRASEVIGMDVQGSGGKSVGTVRDLVVNITTGDVRYAMLEFDPGVFKSEKVFGVPLSELSFPADGKHLVYSKINRAQIEKTAVSKADWQIALDNRRYIDGLDRNFGFSPPTGEARSFRATQLLGKNVDSRSGHDIGQIQDLVLDMGANKVQYAVLAFDPSWFTREKLFAFRLSSFMLTSGKNDLVLDVDQSRLQAMKNFDAAQWGHLNDLNHEEFVNAPGAQR
ncbi:MAG: PRC-barrel domain-containing protein [Pseudomonadota bacterium]|nr:PRC-barrel domain-containing protein [Pseudomonadota bacterium]